jgi:hypothetical protein
MVSESTSPPRTAGPAPDPVVRRLGYGPVRFTLNDTLEMVQQGILPEDGRIELLDGSLVYRDRFDLRGDEIVEGPKHNYVVAALAQLSPRIDSERRHLRTQSTLVCSETHAPVPDAVILRGTLRDYRDRLATADAFCVIEVADSSYERDTGEKLTGYAKAGVQQYVVINLRARTAEIFTNPTPSNGTYPPPLIVRESENLSLRLEEAALFAIPLSELMP